MADVFISYKSERRLAARQLADVLASWGYTVWWDRELVAGRSFDLAIERELRLAKCVVVLWCGKSVSSHWVLEEALLASNLAKLIPVWLEKAELPLGFTRAHTLDITGWDGSPYHDALRPIVSSVEAVTGKARIPDNNRQHEISLGCHYFNLLETAPSFEGEQATPPKWDAMPLSETEVLDRIYERKASLIGDGHRIIFGVAGSGKTVLLLAKAKMLANDSHKKILVLCFNKALAAYFRSVLRQSNITSLHFHAWGASLGATYDEDVDRYGNNMLRLIGFSSRFDAVLVDEGQDFPANWFRCAKAALIDPDQGNLLVAYDGAQQVYRQKSFSWSQVGIRARGRTHSKDLGLHLNYRNTREIVSAAESFCTLPTEEDADVAGAASRIDPDLSTRQGARPTLLRRASRTDECREIEKRVATLISELGTPASDIAVIWPRLPTFLKRVHARMRHQLATLAPVVFIQNDLEYDLASTGIRMLNVHQSKGLQFKHVFMLWTDLLPWQDEDQDRTLLYIALTRAEETLTLTYSDSSPFVEKLLGACRVEQQELFP